MNIKSMMRVRTEIEIEIYFMRCDEMQYDWPLPKDQNSNLIIHRTFANCALK